MPTRRNLVFPVTAVAIPALAAAVAGCGGANGAAVNNRTFYDTNGPVGGAIAAANEVEHPYPPLDAVDPKTGAKRIGVSVLFDGVRFARPAQWMLRDAGVDHGQAFVRYVSPHAFSFALYERSDAPTDPWREVLQRYEDDVTGVGAKVLGGGRIPVAAGANQGRAYTVEQKAAGGETEPPSVSREIVVRSDHRVILVQIVTQDRSWSRIGGEVLSALRQLEVL